MEASFEWEDDEKSEDDVPGRRRAKTQVELSRDRRRASEDSDEGGSDRHRLKRAKIEPSRDTEVIEVPVKFRSVFIRHRRNRIETEPKRNTKAKEPQKREQKRRFGGFLR